MLKCIGVQAYRLTLPNKYAYLHLIFSVQMLENYYWWHDNAKLMTMPNLKNIQDEWTVEKVHDKWQIRGILHYLVKWASWLSKYNFYKPLPHLAKALKTIADYKHKLKHKKKTKQTVESDDDNNSKMKAPRCKQHSWASSLFRLCQVNYSFYSLPQLDLC